MTRRGRRARKAKKGNQGHVNKYARFSKAEEVRQEFESRAERVRKAAEKRLKRQQKEDERLRQDAERRRRLNSGLFVGRGFDIDIGGGYGISTEDSNYLPREYTTAEPEWMNRGSFSGEYDF